MMWDNKARKVTKKSSSLLTLLRARRGRNKDFSDFFKNREEIRLVPDFFL